MTALALTAGSIDRLLDDLRAHLPPLCARAYRDHARALVERMVDADPLLAGLADADDVPRRVAMLIRAARAIDALSREIEGIDHRLARLRARARSATSPAELRRHLADHVTETVIDPRRRRADMRALDRHLDVDALAERAVAERARRSKIQEVALAFIERAGHDVLASAPPSIAIDLVDAGVLETVRGQVHAARWQTRLAALATLIRLAPRLGDLGVDTAPWLADAEARARDDEQPWVHAAAVILARRVVPDVGLAWMRQRLLAPRADRRAFLVRGQLVDDLGREDTPDAHALLDDLVRAGDPSEHVRIQLAGALAAAPRRIALPLLGALAGAAEPSPRVRASAAIAICAVAADAARAGLFDTWARIYEATRLLCRGLRDETHPLPLRIACEEIAALAGTLGELRPGELESCAPALSDAVLALHRRAGLPGAVHDAAAAAAEALDRELCPDRRAWTAELARWVEQIPPGQSLALHLHSFPEPLRVTLDESRLGRVMADLSAAGFGLCATLGTDTLTLWRGDVHRRRLWRVLHEIASPAPNKRQGHLHTVGRVMSGQLRAHPGRLDEETAAFVPGERVRVDRAGGWGRHLPLVDDLLDLPLWQPQPVSLFSSFGVTTIEPPPSLVGRLRARCKIALGYRDLAGQRLASLRGIEPWQRAAYVDRVLAELGIAVSFAPYPHPRAAAAAAEPCDEIAALFGATPALAPASPAARLGQTMALSFMPGLAGVSDWFSDHAGYLLSPSGNSQTALALFVGGLLGYQLIRHYRDRRRIESACAAIPLSIGGWGTRGKSGTERLKAGLFRGLGCHVAVKTTGCEAMVIDCPSDGEAEEIFLHRPGDKASIWEQRDVLELAASLGAEVFLWECMALRPQYAEILGRDWMQDELVTLTNAHPDHEDVQGPTGADVAATLGSFVPAHSTLVTTEVNFLPVFERVCRERDSACVGVSPRDADLLAEDLLALFPYQEHPRNIALVARLGELLGIERTYAIGLMAENVVADLGALKAYPTACVRGRRLTFINAMSANERAGFVASWERSGAGAVEPSDPRRRVVTVVNNRADRVARSQAFSRILVDDVAADRHVLIGTNVAGLVGTLGEEINRATAAMTLVTESELGGDPAPAVARLARHMARLRIPAPDPAHALHRLEVAARGAGLAVDRAARPEWWTALCRLFAGAPARADDSPAALRARVGADRELSRLFRRGLVDAADGRPGPELVGDATRDDVIDHMVADVARLLAHAALRARVVDVVERGGAAEIDALHRLFRARLRELFLDSVIAIDDPEITGDQIIARCAAAVAPGTDVTLVGVQNIKGTGLDFVYRWVALEQIERDLDRVDGGAPSARAARLAWLKACKDPGAAAPSRGRPARRALRWLEAWLDPIDSMRRARRSRQIWRDLVNRRISHARAALEMRRLHQREKGGWLGRPRDNHLAENRT